MSKRVNAPYRSGPFPGLDQGQESGQPGDAAGAGGDVVASVALLWTKIMPALWDSGHGRSWYGVGWAFPMWAVKDRSIVVLFVDDDAGFAAMGALYLESQGMRPIVVSSSMAALDVFETQAIDVVVTDIKLGPDEPHGLALARMIRHKNLRMPIILMTVDPIIIDGEALPGPLLQKPFDFADLAREIKQRATR